MVLAEPTIKFNLINYARSVIFSTAPSFVALAAVKAGYELLASEDGERVRAFLVYQKKANPISAGGPYNKISGTFTRPSSVILNGLLSKRQKSYKSRMRRAGNLKYSNRLSFP